LTKSLSVCIRFETLWPRAFQGFLRNPLFGSGYATLNKEIVGQFTEAESTDNNFLRTLGETGALGFITFYGAIGLTMWYAFQAYSKKADPWITALAIGSIAASGGLLLNATYIDVFAASKVAYMYWALQGICLAAFVKFGGIAPKFDYVSQNKKQDTQQLSLLLQQVEQQAENLKSEKGSYLSSKKRREKSQRTRKRRT
jgi:O-antigen ligase